MALEIQSTFLFALSLSLAGSLVKAQSAPTNCPSTGAIDVSATSYLPSDGSYHFRVCSGGSRWDNTNTQTCKVGDKIPLFFDMWAPYVNMNYMNITLVVPSSANYPYMSFTNESAMFFVGSSISSWNTTTAQNNFYYTYGFNDNNATQVQLQLNPITVTTPTTAISQVKLSFFTYAMIQSSPDISSVGGTMLNISATVDMIDQVGYQSSWVTQWGCNFVYDLPIANASTVPTFAANGPSVIMVGDVVTFYVNITSYDLLNYIAVDVNGPNNDSTIFNILLVSYNPMAYGSGYSHLPGANPIADPGYTGSLLGGVGDLFGIPVNSTSMLSWSAFAMNGMYRENSNPNITDNIIGIVIVGQVLSAAQNNTNYTLTVAVELNTQSQNPSSSIFVAQLQFLTLVLSDNSTADLFDTPSFAAYTTIPTGVLKSIYPIFVNLSAIGTMTNYQLEVYTDISASTNAMATVIAMSATSVGGNYPGFFPGTPTYSATQFTGYNDYGVWYLGQITNTLLSTNNEANNIVLRVDLALLNSSCTVAVGVRYNVGQLNEMFWTATYTLSVATANTSATPTISWVTGSSNLTYSSIAPFWLQFTLPPGQVVYPLTVQVALPVYYPAGSAPVPLLTICRVMVGGVGGNIATANNSLTQGIMANSTVPNGLSSLNPTYQMPGSFSSNGSYGSVSMVSGGVMQANSTYITFNLPAISNLGRYNYPWEMWNNTFSIQFALMVSNYNMTGISSSNYPFINGTPYWTNVIVSYGSSVWSTISLLYVSSQGMSSGPTPTLYINNQWPTGRAIYMGEIVNFDIALLMQPNSQSTFNITVIANNSDVWSVTQLSLANRGLNFPCVCNPTYTYNTGTFSYATNNSVWFNGNMGNVYTGMLSNIGLDTLNPNDTISVSINSMVISVSVQVRGDATVTVGAQYPITYIVQQIGGSGYFTGQISYTINPSVNSDSYNQTSLLVSQVRNYLPTYPRGGAVGYSVNLTTFPLSLGVYTVAATASYNMTGTVPSYSSFVPANSPIVGAIQLTYAGSNLPSMNNKQLINTLSLNKPQNISSPTFDMQTVGSASTPWAVNNIGYYERVILGGNYNTSTTLWQADRNVMTFEVYFCLPASLTSLTAQNTTNTISIVKNGTSSITVSSVAQYAYVSDSPALNTVYSSQTPIITLYQYNATSYYIGAINTWALNITLLSEVTIDFYFSINSPLQPSVSQTLFSFFNVRVLYQGVNLPCTLMLRVTNTSTYNNGQNDTVQFRFYLTNTRLSARNPYATYNWGLDDTVIILFDMLTTDAWNNKNGSNQTFSVYCNSSLASSLAITSSGIPVICAPAGDQCIPILQYLISTNISNAVQGTAFRINTVVNHTNRSHADAFTVVVRYFLPPFVSFNSINSSKTMSYYLNSQNVIVVSYSMISITDNVTIVVTSTLDPNRTLPLGMLTTHAVIPVDVSYYQANKNSVGYPNNNTYYYTGFQLLEFDFFVPDCSTSLGMLSGTILDCQISASSSANGTTAAGARLNGATWRNAPRGPPFAGNEYLQINLPGYTRITGFIVQADSNNASYYTTTFRLQYSQESVLWLDYLQNGTTSPYLFNVTSAPASNGTYIMMPSQMPVNAYYIRIFPMSNSFGSWSHPLRVEVLGCVSINSTSPCTLPITVTTPASDYVERNYLLDSFGNLYACMLSGVGGVPGCSMTTDSGSSWYAIDNHVANIQFYVVSTKQLYGLGWDLTSRVRSDDGGYTWYAIMQVDYATALATCPGDCKVATTLPWIDYTTMSNSLILATYGRQEGSTYYTVTNSGICTSDAAGACSTTIAWWGQSAW